MKQALYERMGILSATALALAVVLAYSLWGVYVLREAKEAGLSRASTNSAVATAQ